jgi:hypothetical protein
MYTKYAYKAGSTQANIVSDLVALLTGETNKANLSASCDQSETFIVSTVAAGWTLHDAASTTNGKVVKAARYDNGAAYKFAEIVVSSATTIYMYVYETFDSGTHSGTNKTTNTYYQRIDLTNGGYIHVSACSRTIALCAECATTVGDTNSSPTLLNELTKTAAFYTTSIPSFTLVNIGARLNGNNLAGYLPTATNNLGYVLPSSNSVGRIYYDTSPYTSKTYGTGVNTNLPVYPLRVQIDDVGEVGELYQTYILQPNIIPMRTTVTIASVDYIVLPAYNNYAILVKKE